jgi:hypothetical protein
MRAEPGKPRADVRPLLLRAAPVPGFAYPTDFSLDNSSRLLLNSRRMWGPLKKIVILAEKQNKISGIEAE